MRGRDELDSGKGIVRTDTDHTVLRYITHMQGRDFQLIMDVEVKEFGKEPDPSQADILFFKHQIATRTGINMHKSGTVFTHKLQSKYSAKKVSVRYCGLHLLQFEKTNPADSEWIKWNHRKITENTLIELLQFKRNPEQPRRPMIEFLRDRHMQVSLFNKLPLIFGGGDVSE
jgi:hypothetical protein